LGGYCTSATKLGQTVGDVENQNDKGAIRWAFDFKIAEERVGAEEVKGFVDNVCLICFSCMSIDGLIKMNVDGTAQNTPIGDGPRTLVVLHTVVADKR
jgi:hypothetical protein